MVNVFRSEDLVVPEELGAAELGRPVSSNRETPEGKTSPQIGRPGWPGIHIILIIMKIIHLFMKCYKTNKTKTKTSEKN